MWQSQLGLQPGHTSNVFRSTNKGERNALVRGLVRALAYGIFLLLHRTHIVACIIGKLLGFCVGTFWNLYIWLSGTA